MSKEIVKEIIAKSPCGYIATAVDKQPHIRPMIFVMPEDLILWSSTYTISGKVKEFENNSKVEICFDSEEGQQARMTGIVSLSQDHEKKTRLFELNPHIKRHFEGPSDPNLVLVEINPVSVKWKNPGFTEYTDIDL